jgi:hypothetical protein
LDIFVSDINLISVHFVFYVKRLCAHTKLIYTTKESAKQITVFLRGQRHEKLTVLHSEMEYRNVNVTHQNNVAIRRPTPIQSTNITYKRNLTKPQKPSLSTKAKPTEDAEKKEKKKNCNKNVSLLGCNVV